MTVYSMTGFGQAAKETPAFTARVELRTVNHRFFKFDATLPDSLHAYEHAAEEIMRSAVTRGVVRLDVSVEPRASVQKLRLEMQPLKEVHAELNRLKRSLGQSGPVLLETLLGIPYLWNNRGSQDLPASTLWPAVSQLLRKAMKDLLTMRDREGRALTKACLQRLDTIERLTGQIERHAPEVLRGYEDRLRKRVQDLLARTGVPAAEIDLAKEIAVMADKCDITEEVARLRSHLKQFRGCLTSPGGEVGRRLEFILQEMVRETSTLAAKSNDFSMADGAVRVKVELEKLKELVENIE